MHNKTPPSPLEAHLGYWLRCLSNLVSGSFAARLAKQGTTVAQWVVLRTLHDHPGATLAKAAAEVGVDKSTLSRAVERLVRKGLVDRAAGRDRRSAALGLTAAGRRRVGQLATQADANDAMFFRALTGRRREEFVGTIRELLAANGWDARKRGRDRME